MTEVTEPFGNAVVVEAEDKADQTHRWWFTPTDEGRLVLGMEVVVVNELSSGRHTVDEPDVPDVVRAALEENGYDTIVDEQGFEI